MAASGYLLRVNDNSPQIVYAPLVDPGSADVHAGWKAVYSGSNSLSQPGAVGEGISLHVTSLDGAKMSLEWTGIGIQLLGNITNATYDVLLDGQMTTDFTALPDSGSLVDLDGLPNMHHNLTLVARMNNDSKSSIKFDKAILKAVAPTWSTNLTVDTAGDTALAFNGRWSFTQTGNLTFHETSSAGDFSVLRFNGAGIALSGYRNTTSGRYQVELDGETAVLDGQSLEEQPATLFYRTGLDPSVPHILNVTNLDPGPLAISGATIISVSGAPPPKGHSLTGGPLIGIVVGVILGTLLLMALLLWWLRRRRARPQGRERLSNLIHWRQRRSSCFQLWRRDADAESVDHQSVNYEPEKGTLPLGQDVGPTDYPRPPREYAPGNRRTSARSSGAVIDIGPQLSEEIFLADGLLRPNGSALLDATSDAHPYLTFNNPSPFAVDFDGTRRPATTPNASTTLMQPAQAATTVIRNTVHSFLDLASSISSSSRRNLARHSRSSSGSGRSPIPVPLRGTSHSRGNSGSSPSFPYPMLSPASRRGNGGSSGTEEPPSPGHSIPHTVSDIHFRPADEVSDSDGMHTRPVSGATRAGHPPLSTHVFGSPASPVILQHLLRSAHGGLPPRSPGGQWAQRRESIRKSLVAGPRSLPKPPTK